MLPFPDRGFRCKQPQNPLVQKDWARDVAFEPNTPCNGVSAALLFTSFRLCFQAQVVNDQQRRFCSSWWNACWEPEEGVLVGSDTFTFTLFFFQCSVSVRAAAVVDRINWVLCSPDKTKLIQLQQPLQWVNVNRHVCEFCSRWDW